MRFFILIKKKTRMNANEREYTQQNIFYLKVSSWARRIVIMKTFTSLTLQQCKWNLFARFYRVYLRFSRSFAFSFSFSYVSAIQGRTEALSSSEGE